MYLHSNTPTCSCHVAEQPVPCAWGFYDSFEAVQRKTISHFTYAGEQNNYNTVLP